MEEEIKKIEEVNTIRKRNCPYCKHEIEINTGLHNWKNLFRMPTFNDWMFLLMLILVLASVYAYKNDIKVCKEFIQNQSNSIYDYSQGAMNQLNLSGLDLTEEGPGCSLNTNASCDGQQTG